MKKVLIGNPDLKWIHIEISWFNFHKILVTF